LSPAGLRRIEAAHHLGEVAPAGELAELVRIERVHRHVDPLHADVGQLAGVLGELAAVGGQRQLLEGARSRDGGRAAEQAHDVLAHQRLAAGQAQLPDAAAHEGAAQPLQLLERQHLGLGQEGHVLGHAIDAAEIAAVRHRDAQIGDMPAKRIDHDSCDNGEPQVARKRLKTL
jgi:hypothetical protein